MFPSLFNSIVVFLVFQGRGSGSSGPQNTPRKSVVIIFLIFSFDWVVGEVSLGLVLQIHSFIRSAFIYSGTKVNNTCTSLQ